VTWQRTCVGHGLRKLSGSLIRRPVGGFPSQLSAPSPKLCDLQETHQRLQVGEQLLPVHTTRERANELSRRSWGKQTEQAVEIAPNVQPDDGAGLVRKKRFAGPNDNRSELGTGVLDQIDASSGG
jgi:hypothetical protein